jgi:hypothetical protein
MSVTGEYLHTGELAVHMERTLHQMGQADDRGYGEHSVGGVNKSGAVFQHLCLTLINKNDCPPDVADI